MVRLGCTEFLKLSTGEEHRQFFILESEVMCSRGRWTLFALGRFVRTGKAVTS
jgi:hypothetical protein